MRIIFQAKKTTKTVAKTTVAGATAGSLPVTLTAQTSLLTGPVARQPIVLSDMEEGGEEFENPKIGVSTSLTPSRHLATTLGLNTDRIQVMKASFFADVDSAHTGPSHSQTLTRPALRPVLIPKSHLIPPTLTNQENLRGFSSLSVENLSTFSSLQSSPLPGRPLPGGLLPREQPPVHHPSVPSLFNAPRHQMDRIVPLRESIVCGCTGLYSDMGVAMGRSFRVGWGPNWTLAHTGSSLTATSLSPPPLSLFSLRSEERYHDYQFTVTIEKVDASPWMKNELLTESCNIKVCSFNFPFSHFVLHTPIP